MNLRKRNKCKLSLPAWFEIEFLEGKLQEEKQFKDTLSSLPYNFFEIFHILNEDAQEDFDNYNKLKSQIEELRQIRNIKITTTIKNLEEKDFYL